MKKYRVSSCLFVARSWRPEPRSQESGYSTTGLMAFGAAIETIVIPATCLVTAATSVLVYLQRFSSFWTSTLRMVLIASENRTGISARIWL